MERFASKVARLTQSAKMTSLVEDTKDSVPVTVGVVASAPKVFDTSDVGVTRTNFG